jgi:methylated-DNA-[protein]-cysteine S-methyltransferase
MGWVCAVARHGRLIATTLPMSSKAKAVAACTVRGELGRSDAVLSRFADDARRYFGGARVDLSQYAVDLSDEPRFRRAALEAARTIPYGEVRTYAWLAARAGRPHGARAAGGAMKRNPLPLVIPCHRVVGAGGRLVGFGGGLEMKAALLRLEGVPSDGLRVREL